MDHTDRHEGVRAWVIVVAFIAALAVFAGIFLLLHGNATSEQAAAHERSLRMTAAECYAVEGRYPDSLEYIEKKYNLQLSTERFRYYYKYNGEGEAPDIRVTVK